LDSGPRLGVVRFSLDRRHPFGLRLLVDQRLGDVLAIEGSGL